jgi:four helix bundle protein
MENKEFNPSFFRFEDLRVYQKALDYYIWVQINTEMFPHSESHPLVKSFVLDALEIAAKISDGSSKNKTRFIDNLRDAITTIRRCIVYTSISEKLSYFSEEQEESSRTELTELTRMIGALISSLQRERPNKNHKQETNYHNY